MLLALKDTDKGGFDGGDQGAGVPGRAMGADKENGGVIPAVRHTDVILTHLLLARALGCHVLGEGKEIPLVHVLVGVYIDQLQAQVDLGGGGVERVGR